VQLTYGFTFTALLDKLFFYKIIAFFSHWTASTCNKKKLLAPKIKAYDGLSSTKKTYLIAEKLFNKPQKIVEIEYIFIHFFMPIPACLSGRGLLSGVWTKGRTQGPASSARGVELISHAHFCSDHSVIVEVA